MTLSSCPSPLPSPLGLPLPPVPLPPCGAVLLGGWSTWLCVEEVAGHEVLVVPRVVVCGADVIGDEDDGVDVCGVVTCVARLST
ncbi:MAG: hypothetical protein DHS20C09_11760 [marine bacterium B5-7]|nr:MAG: hypothetical protein DHS20C09_11760 [marine bacterium B5-7]